MKIEEMLLIVKFKNGKHKMFKIREGSNDIFVNCGDIAIWRRGDTIKSAIKNYYDAKEAEEELEMFVSVIDLDELELMYDGGIRNG